MNVLGIIPARFASSRLPGKPLADIDGKPMIQWVYENALPAVNNLIVATDDKRIVTAVKQFGGNCVMTSSDHINGTSRCMEVLDTWLKEGHPLPDVVINIQGDEPLIEASAIRSLAAMFVRPEVEMATLAQRVSLEEGPLQSGSDVFLTCDIHGKALYFSRNVIPFQRDVSESNWASSHTYLRHVGMYAFRPDTLRRFTKLPESTLEKAEKLEQLRWLENGFPLHVAVTEYRGISVDTPEDLHRIRKLI